MLKMLQNQRVLIVVERTWDMPVVILVEIPFDVLNPHSYCVQYVPGACPVDFTVLPKEGHALAFTVRYGGVQACSEDSSKCIIFAGTARSALSSWAAVSWYRSKCIIFAL